MYYAYFRCVQKILKLENQNKELQEQKKTLEIKLQEKTEEMKGMVTKRSFKGVRVGWSCKVKFSARVNNFSSNESNINAGFTVNLSFSCLEREMEVLLM